MPGPDHLPWVGDNPQRIIDEIEQFLTGARSEFQPDRVLATLLFTDIVDSTDTAQRVGDDRWRNLLHAHDSALRSELARFRGTEIKKTGDGFPSYTTASRTASEGSTYGGSPPIVM